MGNGPGIRAERLDPGVGDVLGNIAMGGAATIARTVRDRIDGLEFRTARALMKRAAEERLDVVYLGDSMNFSFGGAGDARWLSQMLQDELGSSLSLFSLAGGSYHPALWESYLRLLPPSQTPRVVIHALSCRLMLAPWAQHPLYHYRQQIEVLRAVANGASPLRLRGGFPPPRREEMKAYNELPHRTLVGDLKVGDYLSHIRSEAAGREEQVRWLYAFHHGGPVTPEAPGLPALDRFASTLAERGCHIVAFHAPVCLPRGRQLLGEELADVVHRNVRLVGARYRAHAGPRTQLLDLTDAFEPDEFVDPDDATEHLNGAGRLRLARLLVEHVRAALCYDATVEAAAV
jgi:hypothetical protein